MVRLHPARTRLAVCAVVGVVAWTVAGFRLPWELAAIAGWDAVAGVMVVWILAALISLDGPATQTVAMREDDSRIVADIVLVGASVASLVGVGFTLLKSGNEQGGAQAADTALAILTVVLSWTVVHIVYMLRYARLHYMTDGGVDFGDDAFPDYRDFAYLAFTIGMTYQVSDTGFTNKTLRRTATHHALLSYLFGTVVVAMTINVVASLVR